MFSKNYPIKLSVSRLVKWFVSDYECCKRQKTAKNMDNKEIIMGKCLIFIQVIYVPIARWATFHCNFRDFSRNLRYIWHLELFLFSHLFMVEGRGNFFWSFRKYLLSSNINFKSRKRAFHRHLFFCIGKYFLCI